MPDKTPINPSLLIGLGGTGQKSLLKIRERLMQTYGTVPPQVRLLSIDTTGLEEEARKVLRDDEFVKLEVKRVKEVVDRNADDLEAWMDMDNIPFQTIKNIDRGAGQIRQLGRFTLLYHIDRVLPQIEKALKDINSVQTLDNPEFAADSDSPRQIVFFGSIAGGTGAGTLLDLACATSSLPEARDYNRYAYLVMPGVYQSLPNCHYVEENGYALLKELDMFMGNGRAIERGDYGDVFDVDVGPTSYKMKEPFDQVLLVDSTNMAEVTFADAHSLAEAIGVAVFTTLGGVEIGKAVDDVLVNPGNIGRPWEGDMQCWYSSFGVAELFYPRERFAEYGLRLYCERLVDQMQVGQQSEDETATDTSSFFETFIRDHALRERGKDSNEILDAVLSPTSKRFSAQIPSDVKKDDQIERIWQKNTESMDAFIDDVKKSAAKGRAAQVERIRGLIDEQVESLVRTRGGNVASNFANRLAGHFDAISQEMQAEHEAAKKAAENAARNAAGLKSPAKEKTKKLFGKKEAVEQVLAGYRETLNRQARTELDKARTAELYELCQSIGTTVVELGDRLSDQQASVGNLQKRAQSEVESARESLSGASAFQIPVEPDVERLELPEPKASHFYEWLSHTEQSGALDFWDRTAEDAMEFLLTYAREQDVVASITGGSLSQVLAAKTDAERDSYLKRIDQRAQPLISYDFGADKMGRSEKDDPTSMYLVGASKQFFELFEKEPDANGEIRDLETRLSSLDARDVQTPTVEDPDRAYFFRFFGAMPVYALTPFQALRSEYLEVAKQERNWSLHLDKRWDDLLPDLDPENADDENVWIWALAASDIDYLRSVHKTATHYTLEYQESLSDGSTQSVTIQLGQGRNRARRQFLANRDWVNYAEQRIQEAIKSNGNDRVLSDLASYNEKLKKEKTRADESLQDGWQGEIEAIADYRARLQQ